MSRRPASSGARFKLHLGGIFVGASGEEIFMQRCQVGIASPVPGDRQYESWLRHPAAEWPLEAPFRTIAAALSWSLSIRYARFARQTAGISRVLCCDGAAPRRARGLHAQFR